MTFKQPLTEPSDDMENSAEKNSKLQEMKLLEENKKLLTQAETYNEQNPSPLMGAIVRAMKKTLAQEEQDFREQFGEK